MEITTAPHLTTFKVSKVKVEKVDTARKAKCHPAAELELYRNANLGEILAGTKFEGSSYIRSSNNGLVYSAIHAYNRHHNLILRPDDIWLAVMTQFSFYLNANAEALRSKFVNFEGKRELSVAGAGNIRTAAYDHLVLLMEEQIHKNLVDESVRDWIMPNFSTTTKEDRVTSGVVFMAAMKKYFEYKMCLMCGIPLVSLDGILQDWKDIRKRLDKLDEYNLSDWKSKLVPIFDEFVNAKSGKPNVEFWEKIAHYEGGGSGPTYLSGWITAFCYFNEDGQKLGTYKPKYEWPFIDTSDIPSGVVKVPVTVDDNGTEYKTVMLAGSMAQEVKDDVALQPRSEWIIAIQNEKEKRGDDMEMEDGIDE